MGNVLGKSCRENLNTHFMFNNSSENRTVYEIMSKNAVECEWPQMVTIWRIRVACWINKATWHSHAPRYPHASTHAHVCTHRPVSKIYSFSTAIMIRKRTSVLRCMYIAPLACYDRGLLGCYFTCLGNCFPTFWRNMPLLSPGLWVCLEDDACMFVHNCGKK